MDITLGGGWNRYDGDYFVRVIWARYAANSEIQHEFYRNKGIKEDLNIYAKATYHLTNALNIFGNVQYRRLQLSQGNRNNRQL